MSTDNFFDETTDQSLVKATIVSKYFWAWAKVIIAAAKKHGGRIAYIDLFAGPGRYKNGTKSTPLLILEKAIEDADMRNMLVSMFNDKDENNSHTLESAIKSLPGVEKLRYPPKVDSHEVGADIVKQFEKMHLVPTLFFVDPWGYKGLSLELVNSVLKDWGCDCIFFFNYNRINMGLGNPLVQDHMNSLFGKERADQLRIRLESLSPEQRELEILEEICQALKGPDDRYVLPFCFKNDRGSRTSHHLIFVSKHFKGYEIMKEIMAKESSDSIQGVPSFEYSPATLRQPLLFEFSRPLDALEGMLLDRFASDTLSMKEIYLQHNVGRPYIKKNYKDVLFRLESEGKIHANPSANERRKDTFGDGVMVTFPRKGRNNGNQVIY